MSIIKYRNLSDYLQFKKVFMRYGLNLLKYNSMKYLYEELICSNKLSCTLLHVRYQEQCNDIEALSVSTILWQQLISFNI